MVTRTAFAALVALVGCAPAPKARPAETTGSYPADARIDRLVDSLRVARKIPGVSVAVMREGVIIHAQGYGFANVEHEAKATAETVYQSGSLGKQFTATLIMMLVGDGKLGLDDPIRKHLPGAPKTWAPITIRHLLTHTSGIGDYPATMDLRRDYTEDQLLQIVYQSPLTFAPGAKWAYSNLAYLTLGVLVHKLTGSFYGDLLAERIFKPLGMGAKIISEADIVPHRAAGYILKDGALKNQDWVSPSLNSTADGALYFTVLDLAKWDAGLGTDRVLPKASLDQMWTPVTLNDGSTYPYGFGWGIGAVNGRRLIEHSGGWQGFLTHIVRYLDDRLTVVVLVNLAAPDSKPGDIAHQIAALVEPVLQVKPVP